MVPYVFCRSNQFLKQQNPKDLYISHTNKSQINHGNKYDMEHRKTIIYVNTQNHSRVMFLLSKNKKEILLIKKERGERYKKRTRGPPK